MDIILDLFGEIPINMSDDGDNDFVCSEDSQKASGKLKVIIQYVSSQKAASICITGFCFARVSG